MRCREKRGSYALVGANGGVLSKYATGIYSSEPADWNASERYDRMSVPQVPEALESYPVGMVTVETYTWAPGKERDNIINSVIVRTEQGARALIRADHLHEPTRALFESGEPFGAKLQVTQDERGRNIGRLAG